MKRFLLPIVLVLILPITAASADWRWSAPNFKPRKVTYSCSDMRCLKKSYHHERRILKKRINIYNANRQREWNYWARLAIPDCTWRGESGEGPQFARFRYTMPNSSGSGAYGKYQMMPGTYASYAKYGDWSPLDQEIAGHKLYQDQGTGPWAAC